MERARRGCVAACENFMRAKKILLGLTTTHSSDWRKKIEEICDFGISEISLFLTGLEKNEREELYARLEKTPLKNIPHAHLRTDMTPEEIDYLTKRFNTAVFNLHPPQNWPLIHDYSPYFSFIYLENVGQLPDEKELSQFAGLCLDFSHWEDYARHDKNTCDVKKDKLKNLATRFPVGCCHVSSVKDRAFQDPLDGKWKFDDHYFTELREFDYILKYLSYLPELISLELTNSIEEQLKVKNYLEKIIGNNQ